MRRVVILSTLFAGVLLGCERSTEPASRSSLRLTVEAPAPVAEGGTMQLMISVRNSSTTALGAAFPGSGSNLHANAVVLTASGDTAWASPGWVTLPMSGIYFDPDDSHRFSLQWALINAQGAPLPAGTYRLKAWLPVISATASEPDEILHSPETQLVVTAR